MRDLKAIITRQFLNSNDLPDKIRAWRSRGQTSPKAIAWGITAVALWVLAGALISMNRVPLAYGEIGTAYRLAQSFNGQAPPGYIGEGTDTALGFPLVYAALAWLTPGTMTALRCFAEVQTGCRAGSLPFVIGVQVLIAVLSIGMIYRLASVMSGNRVIGVVTVVLYLLATRPGFFAGLLRWNVWYLFFLLLYLVVIVETGQQKSRRGRLFAATVAGVALGLGSLFQPLAIFLVPVTAATLFWMPRAPFVPGDGNSRRLGAVLFAAAAIMTCTGVLGLAVAKGYDATAILRQVEAELGSRIAYLGIERSSWLAATVLHVPWLGDLAAALLPDAEVRRLGGTEPDSLAILGASKLPREAFQRAGQSHLGAVGLLLRQCVLEYPVAYVSTMVPILARGVFGGAGIIGLIGLFHVPSMWRFARAGGHLALHALVLIPAAVLLLANASFGGNASYLNPLLPFVYAYAIAYVAGGW